MVKTKNKFYLAVAFVSLLAGQQATLADQHGKAAALSGDQKLAQTHWQGTTVVDLQEKDVTELNKGFIGREALKYFTVKLVHFTYSSTADALSHPFGAPSSMSMGDGIIFYNQSVAIYSAMRKMPKPWHINPNQN